MRYIERHAEYSREEMTLERLLREHPLFTQQDAIGLIAGFFVPEVRPDETQADLLARQVGEVIHTHIRLDEWVGAERGWVGRRQQCWLEGVEFSAADRAYIQRVFGTHSDVLDVWREAQDRVCRAA